MRKYLMGVITMYKRTAENHHKRSFSRGWGGYHKKPQKDNKKKENPPKAFATLNEK